MKRSENSTKRGTTYGAKRYASMLLTILLCIAMLPTWVFAEDETPASEPDQVTATEITEDVVMPADEGNPVEDPSDAEAVEPMEAMNALAEDEVVEEEPAEPDPTKTVYAAKKEVQYDAGGSATYKFTTAVVVVEPEDASLTPERVWITAAKTSMKVQWNAAKGDVDGYLVMRKAGKETVYSQVADVAKDVTTYTDKKAKKKNTAYYYRVLGYKKIDEGKQISGSINWAAGQTTNSTAKSKYEATLSPTAVTAQIGERYTLTLKYPATKNVFAAAKFQWISADKKVATINPTTGNGIARGLGQTTLTGFIASGRSYDATITVVGAIKPAAPEIQMYQADSDFIAFKWKAVNYATSYEIYCKPEGESSFQLIGTTDGIKFTHSGLTADKEYTYYVVARNNNEGYTEVSNQSNKIVQKAEYFEIPFTQPIFTNSTPKLRYGAKDNGVQMEWKQEEENGVEKFEILRGTTNNVEAMAVVATVDGETKAYDYLETAAGTYYYAVRAVGFNGRTEVSAPSKAIKVVDSALLKTHGLTWTSTTKSSVQAYSGDPIQNAAGTKVTNGKVGTSVTIPKGTKVTCIGKAPSEIAKFHKPTYVKVQTADGKVGWVPYSSLKGGVKAVINIKKDYTRSVKENFVNTMGYTSDTNYLCWLCTYTQRVYIFKGSKGKWVLQRSDRVSTGMFSHPTPGIDEKHRTSTKGRIYKRESKVNKSFRKSTVIS